MGHSTGQDNCRLTGQDNCRLTYTKTISKFMDWYGAETKSN